MQRKPLGGDRASGCDLPPWVICHVPHDSSEIPADIRGQFLLNDQQLSVELRRMTDHFTLDLLAGNTAESQIVRAPISRMVVDVERFEDDHLEPMAERGMGVVYTKTSDLLPLRGEAAAQQRQNLLERWYRPHHAMLTAKVEAALKLHCQVLIIDCHSFPAAPLAYEEDQRIDRPQICLGTNEHTPALLQNVLKSAFQNAGFIVGVDAPFSGVMVPGAYFRKDYRVTAVMIEVNRALYMDELTGEKDGGFESIAKSLRNCTSHSIGIWVANRMDVKE